MKKIIVIAGPTGVGESSVTKELMKNIPNSERLVTYTSREVRLNEQEGVDYFFLSKEDFEQKIKEDFFLEYTFVENRNVYYGTSKEYVKNKIKENKILFFNPDLVGAKAMKENFPAETITIFIAPENLEQIKNQLLGRQSDMDPQELENRLKHAAAEIEDKVHYDEIVVNAPGKFKETVERCLGLVNKS